MLPSGLAFDDAVAAELARGRPSTVIVDDAHRAASLNLLRAVLDDPRYEGVQLILTLRAGFEQLTLHRAGLRPDEVQTVRLGRLGRAAIDQLVRSRPDPVEPHDLRLRIVMLAQGRPLVAHIACQAAQRGDMRTDDGELQVWQAYLARLLDPTWPAYFGDVLAVCAAVGGSTRHTTPTCPCCAPRLRAAPTTSLSRPSMSWPTTASCLGSAAA